jgi:tetratricopeptide (TPR) repeat protein
MKFKLSSDSVTDWLRYIKHAGEPLNWLSPYEDNLLTLLRQGLNRERQFRKSHELLTLVFPYFALSLSHTEEWSPLLRDALLMAQDIKDNDLQVKVFRWMGEAYLKVGKHEPARKVFSTALERAEAGQIDDMKVAVYIGLFKLQWFNLKQNITQPLVQQALDTANHIQDRALQADLFDSLAFAYTRLAETEIALGYGQTAFAYWMSIKNHSGIGRTAYTNAAIYMQIGQHKDNIRFLTPAMSFLEIARDELAQTDDKWQYPLLAYEQAGIYFQREEFEEAASWYQQSLSEAEQMNSPHHVVIAQHGLGLALSKLKQFSSARRFLYMAFNHWDDLHNSYEKASLLAGLADLELRDNKQTRARTYIDEGLKYTDEVQDEKLQKFLRDQFQDIIRQLPPQ